MRNFSREASQPHTFSTLSKRPSPSPVNAMFDGRRRPLRQHYDFHDERNESIKRQDIQPKNASSIC